MCLAFSSVLEDDKGTSVTRCPVKYTRRIYFTPFTNNELTEYTSKVNFQFCVEARNLGVLLPGVLKLAEGVADSSEALSQMMCHSEDILRDTWRRVTNEKLDEPFRHDLVSSLVNFVLSGGEQLRTETTGGPLVNTGICYQVDGKVKSPFPLKYILATCRVAITPVYRTLLLYDTGAAVELLFAVRALSGGISVGLDASQNPSRLKPSLYVHQTEAGGVVLPCTAPTTSCILIKLVEKHPAIDFLIIDNPASKASKKLFLVQVSAQAYQNRREDQRWQAIKQKFSTHECFKKKSPLEVYLEKAGVHKNNCFFVYASTADSIVNSRDAPFVKLCKLVP